MNKELRAMQADVTDQMCKQAMNWANFQNPLAINKNEISTNITHVN